MTEEPATGREREEVYIRGEEMAIKGGCVRVSGDTAVGEKQMYKKVED